MQHGYIPEPHSIFENTYKLKAGHYLEFDLKTQKIEELKYWDVLDFYNKSKLNINEHEVVHEVEKLFKSAFEYKDTLSFKILFKSSIALGLEFIGLTSPCIKTLDICSLGLALIQTVK